ncbi:hypothetical protein Pcinc_035105 [Petrolisthes cinctipes]|uniref:Cyclin-like domain-containing protein n=1 Tax=Petrolisthes cinctipes TaxID=88211 RepID=A0AAE1C0I0_PETCI|nr:hypothetical protein Pcinc_035105 [Petrolisthes cinctipes]
MMDPPMEVSSQSEVALTLPTDDGGGQHDILLDAMVDFDKYSRRSSLGADSVLDQDFNEEGSNCLLLEGVVGGVVGSLESVLALQYADDIFDTKKAVESKFHSVNCMADQPQLQFGPETVFVAVGLTDRFLSLTPLAHDCLQLLAVSALFLAAKMEECVIPGIKDLVTICGGTYKHHHFRRMEVLILTKLQFALYGPTPWFFLDHLALKVLQLGAYDK